MNHPVIITVAITGALPKKKDNPAVPVTPSQQVESTQKVLVHSVVAPHMRPTGFVVRHCGALQ